MRFVKSFVQPGLYWEILTLTKVWHASTARKMKFSIKDYFSKWDQIRSLLRIWSHLLKKSLMENFIFLCSAGAELKPVQITIQYFAE